MTDPEHLIIAVLTFRRPADLAGLLPELERQRADAGGRSVEVLVVDNDPEASGRAVVEQYAGTGVRYVHEPRPGIANGRNRALEEAGAARLLVFIDDDERPAAGWLAALLRMYERTGAAAVTGPVLPDYEGEPDPWLVAAGIFVRKEYADGHELPAAGTGNLLLDLDQVRELGLRFDDRFGLTGGSDTLFTRTLVAGGRRIVYAAGARVVDKVPAGRMTRSWGRRRYYRVGNTWSRTSVELARNPLQRSLTRLRLTARGSARLAFGLARTALGVVGRDLGHRARGERAIVRGAGMVAGAWGSVYHEYRRGTVAGAAGRAEVARQAYRRARKVAKRASSYVIFAALWWRNLTSRRSILGDAPVMVSLTTYGPRLRQVALAIESIGRGTTRPRRLVLWVDHDTSERGLPANLRRLQRRGLEVRECADYGSHKKYFPGLTPALDDGLALVTADDDILYPPGWLSGLVTAAADHPEVVSCYRSSRILLHADRIAPYVEWPRNRSDAAGLDVFPTSGAGALYPLAMLRALREQGDRFLTTCPKADDIWLHWVALRAGIRMRQIGAKAKLPPSTPGSQGESLATVNVAGGRNDVYVAGLYDAGDVETLRRAAAPTS